MVRLFQQQLSWSDIRARFLKSDKRRQKVCCRKRKAFHAIDALEPRRLLSTATISVGSPITAATTDPASVLGVNIGYWDDKLGTTQTQQMVEAAGLNEFRFPGGSAADDYHFNSSDNYGYSGGDSIPDFAQFIQSVGGTGIVTIDYGSGSPQEAEAELAYLVGSPSDTTSIGYGLEWNDTAGTWQNINWQSVGYWASLRASAPLATDDGLNFMRIDHPTPFSGINSWEIGNEEYGSWEVDHHGTTGPGGTSTGAEHDPATYAAFAADFASFISADQANLPSISIGIDSDDPTGQDYNNWTRTVLSDGLADGFVPGFISDHSYMQQPGTENDSFLLNDTVSDSASILDWSTRYSDYETLLQQTLGARASGVKIMATEFNSVSYNSGKQTTSLVNGLFIADSLGSLIDSGYSGGYVWDLRSGWYTDYNNSASLYGWREGGNYGLLGAPDTVDPPDTGPYVPYPSYFAEQLVSEMAQTGGQAVSAVTDVSGESVYAVKQADGDVDLLVINKSPTASLTDQFDLSDFDPSNSAQIWQYGQAQDTAQSQSADGASALANFTATLSLTGSNFIYTFPAYSMTVIELNPSAPTVSSTIPSIALTGSNYLELDPTTTGQLDVWAGSSNTGSPTSTYQLSQYTRITDSDSSGGDTLTVNFTNGNPLAVMDPGISFDAAAGGSDALVIIGDNDGDTYAASSGQILVSGGSGASVFAAVPIIFSNISSESIDAGAGPDVLSVSGDSSVDYTAPVGGTYPTAVVSSLSIARGSKVIFNSPNSSRALLELDHAASWNGQLDLQSNDMLAAGGVSALTTINALVAGGYADGAWTGPGIDSSAAANDSSHLTALGVILNSAGISFDDAPILTTDVLVKYTYYGDANLDGVVNADDYTAINNGFSNHLTGWANGDFNYDGNVDGTDFTIIDNAFNSQGASLAALPSATPAEKVADALPIAIQTQSPITFTAETDDTLKISSWKKDALDRLMLAA
jgi:alpha-L-arabinofuranosidase